MEQMFNTIEATKKKKTNTNRRMFTSIEMMKRSIHIVPITVHHLAMSLKMGLAELKSHDELLKGCPKV
jgi:hypothetical protein